MYKECQALTRVKLQSKMCLNFCVLLLLFISHHGQSSTKSYPWLSSILQVPRTLRVSQSLIELTLDAAPDGAKGNWH